MPSKRSRSARKSFESIQRQYDSIEEQIARLQKQQEEMKAQQQELAMKTVMEVFPEILSGDFDGTLREFLLEIRSAWEGDAEPVREDDLEEVEDIASEPISAPENPFRV